MIEVERLEKSFRVARHHRGFAGAWRNLLETQRETVRAVDGVSFAIGAGKSTTIKTLTGVLEPSGGRARGRARPAPGSPRAHRAHRRGLRPAHAALSALLDAPVRMLSLGQRMRCELAASFLRAPPLLFLDEPTIGLDVVAKEAMRRSFGSERRPCVDFDGSAPAELPYGVVLEEAPIERIVAELYRRGRP